MTIIFLLLLYIFLFPSSLYANFKKNKQAETIIPCTEDLMREHGLLNRILLIYEEIIARINTNKSFPLSALNDALLILQAFIEDYHEKIEENYIFPIFENQRKEVRLVKTLRTQHSKGRAITRQLQDILATQITLDNKAKKRIKSLLQKFIRMYRPHEAREDTVLFPQVRGLISSQEFEELNQKLEDSEHELFGEDGFEKILKKIEAIEKELNIYQLESFTPKI